MIKSGKDVLIIVLAATCVIVSLILLPWAELGFKGDFPAWLSWLTGALGIDKCFNELGNCQFAKDIQEYLVQQGAKNFGEYAYSLFLFIALVVAAIAIILIGREESEEKLLLPAKK
jgi:hypothetical protein